MRQVFGKNFEKIELGVETMIEDDNFAQVRKASDRLKIDFWRPRHKLSSAQINDFESSVDRSWEWSIFLQDS